MANIKSQIKRNRQNEKARLRNKGVRSELKSAIKTAENADADSQEQALKDAASAIDKAANRGVLHANAAARQKSRLLKRVRSAAE